MKINMLRRTGNFVGEVVMATQKVKNGKECLEVRFNILEEVMDDGSKKTIPDSTLAFQQNYYLQKNDLSENTNTIKMLEKVFDFSFDEDLDGLIGKRAKLEVGTWTASDGGEWYVAKSTTKPNETLVRHHHRTEIKKVTEVTKEQIQEKAQEILQNQLMNPEFKCQCPMTKALVSMDVLPKGPGKCACGWCDEVEIL